MKRYGIAAGILGLVLGFSYCTTTKTTTTTTSTTPETPAVAKLGFESDVHPIIVSNCSPCHVPSKGGRVAALDNYDAASRYIDNIISRISMQPGDRGFMPLKHPRLSDSTIAVFKQWRADGLGK